MDVPQINPSPRPDGATQQTAANQLYMRSYDSLTYTESGHPIKTVDVPFHAEKITEVL